MKVKITIEMELDTNDYADVNNLDESLSLGSALLFGEADIPGICFNPGSVEIKVTDIETGDHRARKITYNKP